MAIRNGAFAPEGLDVLLVGNREKTNSFTGLPGYMREPPEQHGQSAQPSEDSAQPAGQDVTGIG